MEPFEAYSYLFTDAFITSLIVPMQSYFVLLVMKIFGGYNLPLILTLTVMGAYMAVPINWLFGKLITVACKFKPESKKMIKFVDAMKCKGVFLLVLAGIPVFGAMLVVGAGFIGISLKRTMLFAAFSHVGYIYLIVSL